MSRAILANRRLPGLLAVVGLALVLTPANARAEEQDLWPSLREEVFGSRQIAENDGTVTLYAPERAEDAALVPLSIRIPGTVAPKAVALTLIIDRNPAPVAATFTFGEAFRGGDDIGERQLQTRIRLDSFSKVRAILETADGQLHMSARFVSGAGGCSAAPSKDPEAALAGLGKIDIKSTAEPARGQSFREAQVMIRHPNFTGLQLDPDSRGYVPARFINDLSVMSAGKLLFRMEGGISISENPHIRLSYSSSRDEAIEVEAKDTTGLAFKERFEPHGS